ncbi:MAG TPA: hypothetical protein VEJ63_11570 [Planctomycetota bacterium]|nr:hypothetical protein [Planctomycetota bacterium]
MQASDDHGPVLKLLFGEESSGEGSGEAARAGAAVLHELLAPPRLDKERLRRALERIDEETAATPHTFGTRRAPLYFWAAAAMLVLAVGIALLLPVKAPEPRPTETVSVELLGTHRWRVGDSIITSEGSGIQADDIEGLKLDAGRLAIVTDRAQRRRSPVAVCVSGRVHIFVKNASRAVVRVPAGEKLAAISVYSGQSDAIRMEVPELDERLALNEHSDATVEFRDGKGAVVSRWADTTSKIPPAQPGTVLLRLKTGRVLLGVVSSVHEAGVIFEALQVYDIRQKESVLNDEIAAWTPAYTPRGQKVYAEWLEELLPKQLVHARDSWSEYLEQRQRRPGMVLDHPLLVDARLPFIEYGTLQRGDLLLYSARPASPELGPGWALDASGGVSRLDEMQKEEEPDF